MVPRPGGDSGPTRVQCEVARAERMPELVPMHRQLAQFAGDGDGVVRFLSSWSPPP